MSNKNLFEINLDDLNLTLFEYTRDYGGLKEYISKEDYNTALEVLNENIDLTKSFNQYFEGQYESKEQLTKDIEDNDFNFEDLREIIEELLVAIEKLASLPLGVEKKLADIFSIDSIDSIKRPCPEEAAEYIIKFIDEYNQYLKETYKNVQDEANRIRIESLQA